MQARQRYDSLDRFRIIAAALVVAIHTSPLTSFSEDADFFFTRVLARIAVPFFFMVTGQFVVSSFPGNGPSRAFKYVKKIGLLYIFSILLYLPVGIYANQYKQLGVLGWLRKVVFDGTFYHLWYFPACMAGVLIVYLMSRYLRRSQMIASVLVLYVIGLFGDSYYGLIEDLPVISDMYGAFFSVFSHTRNGLFMAPVFLVLGVEAGRRQLTDKRILWAGLCASFVAMAEEAFLLRHFELQRHDSMYILLLPVMFFLYRLLLAGTGKGDVKGSRHHLASDIVRRHLATASTWIYILHPAIILAVRGAAQALKLNLFIENSFAHYLAVLAGSVLAAFMVAVFLDNFKLRGKKHGREAAVPGSAVPFSQSTQGYASRAWIEIDRAALQQNVKALRAMLPPTCRLMPAVKADAYGHGAVLVAKELQQMGVRSFCVACVQEGIELRDNGIKGVILILGYTHPGQFGNLCKYRLTQTVIDYGYAQELDRFGKQIHVHIGIDTGMHRIGERSGNLESIRAIYKLGNLSVDGLFTHLCISDSASLRGKEYTKKQAGAFYGLIGKLKEEGLPCPKIHMQASYGVLNYPELAGDYARVGIALYGVLSTKEDTVEWQDVLRPVLSLKARVASVKTLYKGESAGYGLAFTARHDMQVATVAIGYADGLPRSLSGGVGSFLLHGSRAPVIGRICMDQTIVDVSGIEGVKAGDEAVIIGRCGGLEISAADMAKQAGTITNEILSRMGARLGRTVI